VILQCHAPYVPLTDVAISHIARRALQRAGITVLHPGAHVVSTTQDRALIYAIAFLLTHKGVHSKWLAISHASLSKDNVDSPSPLLALSFVADK
jgi:hypothetical protein